MSTDLFLGNRSLETLASDSTPVDLWAEHGDLKLVSGRDNLAQAIINRLLTRRGELTDLGHPSYGSRLYTLVGEPNSTRARALADLYIRESLAGEARIQTITSITFKPPSRSDKREFLEAQISVQPVDGEDLVTVSTTLNLRS